MDKLKFRISNKINYTNEGPFSLVLCYRASERYHFVRELEKTAQAQFPHLGKHLVNDINKCHNLKSAISMFFWRFCLMKSLHLLEKLLNKYQIHYMYQNYWKLYTWYLTQIFSKRIKMTNCWFLLLRFCNFK